MAMTTPPVSRAPPPPLEEQVDTGYGKIRKMLSDNREMIFRRVAPYYNPQTQVFYPSRIAPCFVVDNSCADALPLVDEQKLNNAEFWCSLMMCPEDDILTGMRDVLRKLSVENPTTELMVMTSEAILQMMTYPVGDFERDSWMKDFTAHGQVYPEPCRRPVMAATTDLASWEPTCSRKSAH